jgi:diaminohydroxyphosphoribosylaminopyrimidine deaminase / 5-amino-6-(5-phosphoribosylamino)uracil reductase
MIGVRAAGQVAVTGAVARAMAHVMRSEANAVMIGSGTAVSDDPELTCRLPGLEGRSPIRIVVDSGASLPLEGKLAQSARQVPVWVAALANAAPGRTSSLAAAGCRLLACEDDNGRVALPELLEDLAAQGISSVLVEGGAELARSLIEQALVDRLALFTAQIELSAGGVASPVTERSIPQGFARRRAALYGGDRFAEYVRV